MKINGTAHPKIPLFKNAPAISKSSNVQHYQTVDDLPPLDISWPKEKIVDHLSRRMLHHQVYHHRTDQYPNASILMMAGLLNITSQELYKRAGISLNDYRPIYGTEIFLEVMDSDISIYHMIMIKIKDRRTTSGDHYTS